MTYPSRLIGEVSTREPGPTLIIVAGIHGNEPAGVEAAERLLNAISTGSLPLNGTLVALRGNLGALAVGKRFLDQDLNRAWSESNISQLEDLESCATSRELKELGELYHAISSYIERSVEPVSFVDCHTTSSSGPPFAWMMRDGSEGNFLRNFPVPIIYDIESRILGTMGVYFAKLGHQLACVEGGAHEDPRSVEYLEAIMWIALHHAGLLDRTEFSTKFEQAESLLKAATKDIPQSLVINYHHPITARDDYVMNPGFCNFDPIEKNQVLGRDVRGEVCAPHSGRMLLPSYQAQNEDGFLIVNERK